MVLPARPNFELGLCDPSSSPSDAGIQAFDLALEEDCRPWLTNDAAVTSIVEARQDGRLLAALPLMRASDGWIASEPVLRSDLRAPLPARPVVLDALIDLALSVAGKQRVQFLDLYYQGATQHALSSEAQRRRLTVDSAPARGEYEVDLSGGWERTLARFSLNRRDQVQRWLNALQTGLFEATELRAPDQIRSAISAVCSLGDREGARRGGFFASDRARSLFRRHCLALADRRRLSLWTLRQDGALLAFLALVVKRDGVWQFAAGSERLLSVFEHLPVLQVAAWRALSQRGLKRYVVADGKLTHPREWNAYYRAGVRVTLKSPTWSSRWRPWSN
jgi:CelD/BcsL family acetyltransferase involved in cellulose biosynthesis